MAGGGLVTLYIPSVAPILTCLAQWFLSCPCFGLSLRILASTLVVVTSRAQRTYLKTPDTRSSVPIYAIGLSLYESLPGTTAEQIGSELIRTQWLYVVRNPPPHAR